MNIIHSYKVNKLKKQLSLNGFENVVIEIDYTLKSIYENQPGLADTETNRIISFNNPTLEEDTFISYEDLTEEIVISWISQKSKELELYHEKVMDDYINPKQPEIVEEIPDW